MDYSYEIPKQIKQQLIASLKLNNNQRLAEIISRTELSFNDVGFAYHAGLKGDNWDKHALDCNLFLSENDITEVNPLLFTLKQWIGKLLPTDTGLLIRNISIIPKVEEINVDLPDKHGEDWDTLSEDINQALARNEPTLVLDRLHTFSVKFFREICENNWIETKNDKGELYPLHSLVGMLTKHYKKNNVFQSEFAEQALKSSISLFDTYNKIRNEHSYAHDNTILNNEEAILVVKIMAATISFVDELENK